MPDKDEAGVVADLTANRALDDRIRRAAAGGFKPVDGTYVVVVDENGQLSWRQAGPTPAGASGA